MDMRPVVRQGKKMGKRLQMRPLVGALAAIGLAVVLLGVTPFAMWLSQWWTVPADIQPAEAIVVLGGGAGSDGLYLHSSARMLKGMELYHLGLAPFIVFTGGTTDGRLDSPISEGATFLRVWKEFGLPATATRVDMRAANTHENAVESRKLLGGPRSILLVTSNLHMRRASAVFRHEGFTVYPAPVPPRPERLPHPAAKWTTAASLLYEWAAYLKYWLAGFV
jgi:uncharacterized SAM-binding protein YcdF (DUF218 family)